MERQISKGGSLHLDKEKYNLSQVTIGIGWEFGEAKPKGFLEKIFSSNQNEAFDLDAIAFMTDGNGKVKHLGHTRDLGGGRVQYLVDSDVIYFNNLHHPSGHVMHTGDASRGGSGTDDEQIIVDLENLGEHYHKILFLVVIHQGIQKKQHFGMMQNAYIRAVDAQGNEILRYPLSEDAAYNHMQAMIFGEVARRDNGWVFNAIGEGRKTDNFMDILREFVYS